MIVSRQNFDIEVSIHASAKDATKSAGWYWWRYDVSIHASAKDATELLK